MPGIARLGDKTSDHQCDDPHLNTVIIDGSSNVFVNGKNTAFQGCLVFCGDTLGVGSNNVYINGKSVSRLNDLTTFHNGACTESRIITGSNNCFVN